MCQVGIIGIGMISPLGYNSDDVYRKLIKQEDIFSLEKDVYPEIGEGYNTSRVCDKDYNYMNEFIMKFGLKLDKDLSLLTKYILFSILKAIEDSSMTISEIQTKRVAIVIGGSDGESDALNSYVENRNFAYYSSYETINIIAKILGLKKPKLLFIHNACASSNMAVEIGYRMLESSKVDLVIAGGAELYSKRVMQGLYSVNVLSHDSCYPFSEDAEGVVIGEGCGIVILKKIDESTTGLVTKVYAEVVSVASSNGAESMAEVDENSVLFAYDKLFDQKEIKRKDIYCIMGHATGSPYNDRTEAKCIQKIKKNVLVCTIKNTMGYLLGAAGIMGIITVCKIFQYRIIPGSGYVSKHSVMENLNILNRSTRLYGSTYWCNNAFGMGGNNSIVLLKDLCENND